MIKPSNLAAIKANNTPPRNPGDPVDFDDVPKPRYDVRMPARDPGVIITHDVEADAWCRDQCKATWGRAIDRGPGREGCVPVYRFTCKTEACAFRLAFG